MSSQLIIIVSGLLAIALGQCPPGNCPPPVDPPNCGEPDCSIPTNRYHPNALFPSADPNYYYQCAPIEVGVWGPLLRPCACGSVFNAFETPRRCSFWADRTWGVPPGCLWPVPPILRRCDPWCPDCNGPTPSTTSTSDPPKGTGPTDPTPTPPTPTPPTPGPGDPTPTPGPCGCPPGCPPCMWWPCRPCVPCWCRQQQEQQNPMLNWQ